MPRPGTRGCPHERGTTVDGHLRCAECGIDLLERPHGITVSDARGLVVLAARELFAAGVGIPKIDEALDNALTAVWGALDVLDTAEAARVQR